MLTIIALSYSLTCGLQLRGHDAAPVPRQHRQWIAGDGRRLQERRACFRAAHDGAARAYLRARSTLAGSFCITLTEIGVLSQLRWI